MNEKRFTELIEKVARLDSTNDLDPREKREYETYCAEWYARYDAAYRGMEC